MVIVGVLIVLLSLRARRGAHAQIGLAGGDQFSVSHLIHHSSSNHHHNQVSWQPVNTVNTVRAPRISRGFNSPKGGNFSQRNEAELADLTQGENLVLNGESSSSKRQLPIEAHIQLEDLDQVINQRDSNQSSSSSGDAMTDASLSEISRGGDNINMKKLITNNCGPVERHGTDNVALELSELDVPSALNPSCWTPDDDDGCYGSDHQAAIEAALSTVLTVSTLVGFRSDGIEAKPGECCVRHAAQVSNQCSVGHFVVHLTVNNPLMHFQTPHHLLNPLLAKDKRQKVDQAAKNISPGGGFLHSAQGSPLGGPGWWLANQSACGATFHGGLFIGAITESAI